MHSKKGQEAGNIGKEDAIINPLIPAFYTDDHNCLPADRVHHQHRVQHGYGQRPGANPVADGSHHVHQPHLSHPSSRYVIFRSRAIRTQ